MESAVTTLTKTSTKLKLTTTKSWVWVSRWTCQRKWLLTWFLDKLLLPTQFKFVNRTISWLSQLVQAPAPPLIPIIKKIGITVPWSTGPTTSATLLSTRQWWSCLSLSNSSIPRNRDVPRLQARRATMMYQLRFLWSPVNMTSINRIAVPLQPQILVGPLMTIISSISSTSSHKSSLSSASPFGKSQPPLPLPLP